MYARSGRQELAIMMEDQENAVRDQLATSTTEAKAQGRFAEYEALGKAAAKMVSQVANQVNLLWLSYLRLIG